MHYRTLNYKIFQLVCGLLCLSTLFILVTVWLATTNHARAQVANNLDIGERVFTRLLANREQQLIDVAQLLTADFGFKQAVASRDKNTIASVLANHGDRVNADIMTLIDLNGAVISTTTGGLTAGQRYPDQLLVSEAIQNGGAVSFLSLKGRLYQTILLTVEAPRPIAMALLGFEINQTLVEDIKALTELDITISNTGDKPVYVSTLKQPYQQQVLFDGASSLGLMSLLLIEENTYLSQHTSIYKAGDNSLLGVLSSDVYPLFSDFNLLQIKIAIIALVSICLGLILTLFFSKNLTKPLLLLESLAKNIAKGNYQANFHVQTASREIGNLSTAFEVMQKNIEHREKTIQYQVSHDLLTGLMNRYSVSADIAGILDRHQSKQIVSLKMINLKSINNLYGSVNGDQCIKVFAERVQGLGGVHARLNSGELLWIPDNLLTDQQLMDCRQSLEAPCLINDIKIAVNVALGVLTVPDQAGDIGSLFRRLNITVDCAQKSPLLFAAYQSSLEELYLQRLKIVTELKRILLSDHSEFSIYYQPKISTQRPHSFKAEALIRWHSEALGFVSPEVFIPLAEQAGLINSVTGWVVRRVVKDIVEWKKQGIDIQVAINLSVHDIGDPNLIPSTLELLKGAGLPVSVLSFEITESELMADPEKACQQLALIRDLGFSLSIDDFGTGYSSLAYLKDMPVSELKIDKSFVLNMASDQDDQNIVSIVIALANTLGLGVVAEGVEDQQSFDLLREWGCQWIQGYHISKPIPAGALASWLQSQPDFQQVNDD